jgi:hypothetical protein
MAMLAPSSSDGKLWLYCRRYDEPTVSEQIELVIDYSLKNEI